MFRSSFWIGCIVVAVVACGEPTAGLDEHGGGVIVQTPSEQTIFGVLERTDDVEPRLALNQSGKRVLLIVGPESELQGMVGAAVVISGNFVDSGEFVVAEMHLLHPDPELPVASRRPAA